MPQVKLFGSLRQLAGQRQFTAPGSSLREVFSALEFQNPALWAAIADGDDLKSHVRVILNGLVTQDLDKSVRPDDVISIFPPIAGG